jgi:RNase adapter protein RapZ
MMTGGGREMSCPAIGMGDARVLVVTGMSGAGRSTSLKILEDMGYEAFDNLPLSLVPALIENAAADAPAIAVGADARTRGFAIESMLETLDSLVRRLAAAQNAVCRL